MDRLASRRSRSAKDLVGEDVVVETDAFTGRVMS